MPENTALLRRDPGESLSRALGGSLGGWPVDALLVWLLGEGRLTSDPVRLVQAVVDRLAGAGAGLLRVRIGLGTLHPQVRALNYTWRRGRAVTPARITHDVEGTDAFVGSPFARVLETGIALRRRLHDVDAERDHAVYTELRAEGVTDYAVFPLRFAARVGGVIAFATDAGAGFDDDDLTKLHALTEVLTPILETMGMRHSARSLLDTYVGPRTGERVLNGLIKRGDGEVIDAALWFSDLRDFTTLTETLAPKALLATMNAYFELVSAAVSSRGGEVLRFIGDAMLIVFPTSRSGTARAACAAALDAADDAFSAIATLNHRRRRLGSPEISFGLGLHVGTVIYGNVGAPDRLDFTVMGPAVNRTARLESLTKSLGVALLMSREFASAVEAPTRSLGLHAMKGVHEPQEVFALLNADPVPGSPAGRA